MIIKRISLFRITCLESSYKLWAVSEAMHTGSGLEEGKKKMKRFGMRQRGNIKKICAVFLFFAFAMTECFAKAAQVRPTDAEGQQAAWNAAATEGQETARDAAVMESRQPEALGVAVTGIWATEQTKTENSTNIQLYARSAVLMDADSGRILYGKNENEKLPMASTTKIMTCILALENGAPEDEVTVSAYAVSQPKVHLGMYQGQKFRLGDLLYSLMLESHNDSAVAIAEHVGGSVEGFAKMMNQKAREIGCQDTFFITPNGLDASVQDAEGGQKVHSTTAADLARIMKYCIGESPKSGEFLEVTRTQSYSFADTEGKRNYSCNNHNAFLYMMDGALSGKTGFTNNAGYCYVGALRRDGKNFVVALLACGWPNNRTYKWSDTKQLMTYGLENYEYQDVYEETELQPVLVEGGIPGNGKPYGEAFLPIEVKEDGGKELKVLLKEGEKVERNILLPEKLEAPVEAGRQIGAVDYCLDGELLREYSVVTAESMEKLDFPWIFRFIWKQYSL